MFQLFHVNRIAYFPCFFIITFLATGCETDCLERLAKTHTQDGDITIPHEGSDVCIPSEIKFNDRTWIRSDVNPANTIPSIEYDYKGKDPNIKIRYSLGPADSDLNYSFTTYKRDDLKSPWKMNGRYTAVMKSGAWKEMTFATTLPRPSGPYRYSYRNGTVKFSGDLKDGSIIGPAKGFYSDGSLWWKGNYSDGDIDLDSILFYEKDGREKEIRDREEAYYEFERWSKLSVPK